MFKPRLNSPGENFYIHPHAIKRWAERFPDLDIMEEYRISRNKIAKGIRRTLKKQVPRSYFKWHQSRVFKGRYLLVNPNRIIFVMASPETILTVFRLNMPNGMEL